MIGYHHNQALGCLVYQHSLNSKNQFYAININNINVSIILFICIYMLARIKVKQHISNSIDKLPVASFIDFQRIFGIALKE